MANRKLQRREFLRHSATGLAGVLAASAASRVALAQEESPNGIYLPLVSNAQTQAPPIGGGLRFPEVVSELGAKRPIVPEIDMIAEDVLGSAKYFILAEAAQPNTVFAAGTFGANVQAMASTLDSAQRSAMQNSAEALLKDRDVRKAVFGRSGELEPQEVLEIGFDEMGDVLPDLPTSSKLLGANDFNGALSERLIDIWGPMYQSDPFTSSDAVQAASVTDNLGLYITRVKCIDETNPEWFGDDEIALAGLSVDENGDTRRIAEQRIRNDFDDGDYQDYDNWLFHRFNIREEHEYDGAKWPKSYAVSFVLAEKDGGGLTSFVIDLWERVRDRVKKEIEKAIGSVLSTYLGPVIADVIGKAVAWIVDKLVGWLLDFFKDDIFPAPTVSCTVPSYGARWTIDGQWGSTTSPLMVSHFHGHGGHYYIQYYWKLFA